MSLIILVFALVFLFAVLFFVRRFYFNRGTTKVLFTVYAALLIVSAVVYLILPNLEHTIQFEKVKYQNFEELFDRYDFFSDDRETLDFGKLASFKEQEETFSFTEENLAIHLSSPDGGWGFVAVKRTAALTDEIRLVHYRTPFIVGEYNVSKEIPLAEIHLDNNQLSIYRDEYSFDLVGRGNLFPFEMFTKQNKMNQVMQTDVYTGEDLFYLEIPKNVGLEYDETINLLMED